MRKKLHLIIALIAISTNIALGATTVTPGNIGGATLTGETEVIVTGHWNDATLGTLKTKLAEARSTLTTVNMADATLSGEIPNGINEMFWDFQSLTTVTLPSAGYDGEVSFDGTFKRCTLLETIENLEKFTNISNMYGTFQNCAALTSITLPQGTTAESISFEGTFVNCRRLETVENLEEFTNISNLISTFLNCEALTSITLPQGTTAESIHFGLAFHSCTRLETIENMDKFTNISNLDYAFQNCTALTSIALSSVPTDNYTDTFYDANPACVKIIGAANFDNSDYAWTNIVLPFNNEVATASLTGATEVVIQGTGWSNAALGTLKTKLAEAAATLTTVNMADATFTGDIADGISEMFYGLAYLTTVTLPSAGHDGAVSFEGTFYGCTLLVTVENLDRFTKISNMFSTFQGCTALTSITLPQGTNAESISFTYAFSGCTLLETIENLKEFTKISNMSYAFVECAALTAITLPQGTNAASINFEGIFNGCTRLESIENLEEFTKISSLVYAFSECTALTAITLPQGTNAAGINFSGIFSGCTRLESIENLEEFTSISNMSYAFQGCAALTSVTLPQGTTANIHLGGISFNNTFAGCTRLETIENLEEFTDIGNLAYTFAECAVLTSITLPQGTNAFVFSGGINFEGTFAGCTRLETIEIPEEFTNIGNMNYTFAECAALTSVTLSSMPTDNYTGTFYGANPNCLKYIDNPSFDNTNYQWTNVILPTGPDDSWQAIDDIVLDGTAPFHCPEAFAMADGKTITYTMGITEYKTTKANGEITPAWGTICLPFDALLAHPDKEGVYMRAYNGEQGDYWLRTFESSEEPGVVTFAHAYNGDGEDHADIKANIPYIISFPGTGWEEGEGITATEVTFIAAAGNIAATPQGGITAGQDNYLFRTDFKPRSDENTDDLYVLDTENNAFTKSSGLSLGAFDVYFADAITGFSGKRSLSIGGGTGDGTITAIEPVIPGSNPDGLKVYRDGQGALRIESDRAMQVVLYSINGTAVRTLTLKEGSNYVNGLQPGMYIVERQKAVVL